MHKLIFYLLSIILTLSTSGCLRNSGYSVNDGEYYYISSDSNVHYFAKRWVKLSIDGKTKYWEFYSIRKNNLKVPNEKIMDKPIMDQCSPVDNNWIKLNIQNMEVVE